MKQFVHAILSAAALATLAGCAGSTADDNTLFGTRDTLREAMRQDIDTRIEAYKADAAARVCTYNTPLAERLFKAIPAVAQQYEFRTLAYDMESLDGKTKVKYYFASERRMKFVVTNDAGKVLYAQILNGDEAYSSKDGIEYTRITLPEHLNELRLRYDMAMDFAGNAKIVNLDSFEAIKGNPATVEPLEQLIDGKRCWRFDISMINKNYNAQIVMYVSADSAKNQLSTSVRQINGLVQPDITLKSSRFFLVDAPAPTAHDKNRVIKVIFPGYITTDSKDAPQMTIKNLTVNGKIADSEFEPDTLN